MLPPSLTQPVFLINKKIFPICPIFFLAFQHIIDEERDLYADFSDIYFILIDDHSVVFVFISLVNDTKILPIF